MVETRENTAVAMAHSEQPTHIDDAVHGGAGEPGSHPVKWKVRLLTMGGLYPLLTALAMSNASLLEPLPTPLRPACIMPVAAAAMVWVIMPSLSRYFADRLSR